MNLSFAWTRWVLTAAAHTDVVCGKLYWLISSTYYQHECEQSITGRWKVTKANYDHQTCAGGTKKPGMRALFPEAVAIVKSNIIMRHVRVFDPGLFSPAVLCYFRITH